MAARGDTDKSAAEQDRLSQIDRKTRNSKELQSQQAQEAEQQRALQEGETRFNGIVSKLEEIDDRLAIQKQEVETQALNIEEQLSRQTELLEQRARLEAELSIAETRKQRLAQNLENSSQEVQQTKKSLNNITTQIRTSNEGR